MTYHYHIDPGHGWIEVPFSELLDLEIDDKISHYSYRDDDRCFLEEDCDAGVWERAYEQKHGSKPNIREVHHNDYGSPECFIRNLGCYYS